jgi:hypothetical protein
VDVKFDTLPEPLIIGEETEVEIGTGTQTAPVVPISAIIRQEGVKGVLVVSNERVSFHPISSGLQNGRLAAVEGLKEGDIVIIDPAGIKPGQHVRPETKPGVS